MDCKKHWGQGNGAISSSILSIVHIVANDLDEMMQLSM